MVGGVAACGAVKQLTTAEKVSTAFDKLGDSDSLSVSFSLDATAAQLVSLDQGTSDAMKMVDAKNVAGLGATLTLSADKPLSQALKSVRTTGGEIDPTTDPSLGVDLEVHAGGQKSLFEVRMVGGLEYLRVDLDNLMALSDDASTNQDIAGMQAGLGQMPPQYAPLKDLFEGKWVSLDPKQLAQVAKGLGGDSAAAGASGLPTSIPSISTGTRNNLVSALTGLFEQDLTLSDQGTVDGQDHIVVQGSEAKLAAGVQQAFEPVAKAIPGLASAYPTAAPTGVPDKNVSADLYVGKDGSLSKVSFDFWQLNPHGKAGEHLPLSLGFNDQAAAPTAPTGAVPIPAALIQSLAQSMAANTGDTTSGVGSSLTS
ncbi:hypothetical protein [Streptacidiphilus sp. P02-A3a]|uniref:hypothetical protein n=1 Tax=Streptacidiphilus sp. P02-A3a TaxID=2704468 RepID=UPI0015FE31BE|nr:hypothetical protein [Streptacidiphilus sp. P02-A3a]QMU68332.1 hypothetical protein GXP74_08910 [Streptacidiphilus sp. P02-A3a]